MIGRIRKNRTGIRLTCEECGKLTPMKEALQKRSAGRKVVEVGLLCKHCGHWKHSYFESSQMRRAQEKLKRLGERARLAKGTLRHAALWNAFKEAQDRYSQLWDKEQARLAHKLNQTH